MGRGTYGWLARQGSYVSMNNRFHGIGKRPSRTLTKTSETGNNCFSIIPKIEFLPENILSHNKLGAKAAILIYGRVSRSGSVSLISVSK